MSDKELIAEAGKHVPYAAIMDDAKRCMHCADEWPCVTRRLADALEAATRERDAALAAVERVRAIHAPGKIIDVWGKSRSQADDFLVCVECTDPDNWWIAYPCATVATLDGAPEPEEKP